MKIYEYSKCSTCRNAVKWLEAEGYELEKISIYDHPPTVEQIQQWVENQTVDIQTLFNTSGQVYRTMNLKQKLPQLTIQQKIQLLASNGRLIRRPIVVEGQKVTVGFKQQQFEQIWGNQK